MIALSSGSIARARSVGHMARLRKREVGRPKKLGEKLHDRSIGLTPSVEDRLEELAREEDSTLPELVRYAVDQVFFNPRRIEVERALEGTDRVRTRFLSSVPCGPWKEAVDSGTPFVLSEDVADELEASADDFWVRADGESMEEKGILDGDLVCIKGYGTKPPKRGETVLIQLVGADDQYLSALKEWDGVEPSTNRPRLLNGDGTPYALPGFFERYEVIGRAISRMGRL